MLKDFFSLKEIEGGGGNVPQAEALFADHLPDDVLEMVSHRPHQVQYIYIV